jgi:hypothetical protein
MKKQWFYLLPFCGFLDFNLSLKNLQFFILHLQLCCATLEFLILILQFLNKYFFF